MLEQLISEGEALETQAEEYTMGKGIHGVDFEQWTAKVILYLERNQRRSSLTDKAIEVNKDLTQPTENYRKYQFLLGTLKAIRDMAQ